MHLDEKSEYRPPSSPTRQDTFSFAPSPETRRRLRHLNTLCPTEPTDPTPHSAARPTFPKSALIKVRQCRVLRVFLRSQTFSSWDIMSPSAAAAPVPHARHGGMKVYTAPPPTTTILCCWPPRRTRECVVHSSHNQSQPESTFSNDEQTRPEITRH